MHAYLYKLFIIWAACYYQKDLRKALQMAIEIRAGFWQGRRHYVITGVTLPSGDALFRWVGASRLISTHMGELTKARIELWLDLVSNKQVNEVDQYVVRFFEQYSPRVDLIV